MKTEGKIFIGFCDPHKSGKRDHSAYIYWNLEDKGDGKLRFGMQGEIRTKTGKNVSGGQNIEQIRDLFPDRPRVRRFYEIWKDWHLNYMRAGCIHQRAARWEDARINPDDLPNTTANQDERGILAIWIYEKEHKNGLMCKPCPECGYKYGTAWLYEPIPEHILAEIKGWNALRSEAGNA